MMNFLKFGSNRNENSMPIKNEIRLYIHDELHIVKTDNFSPSTSLNTYLRKQSNLTGTKVMCREGGCGCCVVTAIIKHPVTTKEVVLAVNSCLVSIFSCEGWRIVTIEGLKDSKGNYNAIQEALVKYNGTQCGFCTPGMIMSAYAALQNPNLTKADMENSLGGNLCRCTGYRPILEAFKSLSKLENDLPCKAHDIEDMPSCPLKDELNDWTQLFPLNTTPFGLELSESSWYKVFTIKEIFELFAKYPQATYQLVGGNTAKGVYRTTDKELYIDISGVKELRLTRVATIGAGTTLNELKDFFRSTAKLKSFGYMNKLADHVDLVATDPIRNIGTIAGNLSIKYEHNEFPSDIFLILEGVGATLNIVSKDKTQTVTLVDYLKMDMKQKVIKEVTFPPLNTSYLFDSYKIMPRAQNAHAMVNAAFLLQLNGNSVVENARIVYGGINPKFIHATELESTIKNKKLFDDAFLQSCYKTLDDELNPDYVLPDPKPEFRKGLAIALFYKYVLSIAPQYMVNERYYSGGKKLVRPISTATQDILNPQEDIYPITEAISKLEAKAQASGAAKYVMDYPDEPRQAFAALVLAKAAPYSTFDAIDTSKASKVKGFLGFYSSKDIPGNNFFTSFLPKQEKIFADKMIEYYSQPVGMVLGTTQEIAERAADLVTVQYTKPTKKPLLTIPDIIKKNDTTKIVIDSKVDRKTKGNDIKREIKGNYLSSLQYHFHMETQSCNVIPVEDGLDVFPTTQWMDIVQHGIAMSSNIDTNRINIQVRRCGGGYGGKITRNAMPSCQAALGATLQQRPTRIWLPFETNMSALGKRIPCYANYKVGVNEKGVIQYLDVDAYMDYSTSGNEPQMQLLIPMILNGYYPDPVKIQTYHTLTDTPGNISCRGPGTTEGLGLIESVMEHIAYELKLDPIDVRKANWDKTNHPKLIDFMTQFEIDANIDQRKQTINDFNKNHRWRKKGISTVTMAYHYDIIGPWNVLVSVYHVDGRVSIAHGGIEIGQGINTKVAQVCAYCFGIPVEMIQVKPSNNLISPNCFTTGGSATSESVCWAVIKATEVIKDRMKPVKDENKNANWVQLVQACFLANIPLSATYDFNKKEVKPYVIYGICTAEVEIDILTGNHILSRVDLLEDVGNSMNPAVDVGQVEGAFVMGLGLWTLEEIIMADTGEIKTNRTWNYKIPGAKDIPVDFRVKFPKNNANPVGIFKSKAVGEPPLCMACVIPFAIRQALDSARKESKTKESSWIPMNGPTTVEATFMNSLNDYTQYKLN
ncbi:xanthine dehydrogenase-like [Onthophagus taurus]|uniref:xanthine dehydrogenase-like n=1 Tax=Onthophagus taurus TaxID=166361 RepID=UPI0039BDDBA1